MTLQQLKYADAVATCGSLSEASRRVFVTQPTLTEAIRTLEEELRIAIFSRTSRGVTVTREGEEFLASARQILTDNKYIMDALAEYLYKKETITGDEFMLIIREQTRQRQLDVRKAIEIPPAEA
jgi:DNA-binding transcriptional LysR family regulator